MQAYHTYEVSFSPYFSSVFTAENEAEAIEIAKGHDPRPPISVICLSSPVAPKREATGFYGIDAGLCISPERCRASGRCLGSTACTE